jgi:EF-hand domain pair
MASEFPSHRMTKEDQGDDGINQDCSKKESDCRFNRKHLDSEDGESKDCFVFDYEAAASHFGEDAEHVDAEFWNRYEAQNKARQKFGLPALSPEEYVVLQAETKTMGDQLSQDAVQAAFRQFDTNGDGVISLQELKTGLRDILRAELTEEHVEAVMQRLDTSGDGVLQLEEMVSLNHLRKRLQDVIQEEQKLLQLETVEQKTLRKEKAEKQSQQQQQQQQQPGLLKSFLAAFRLDNEDACESNLDCFRPQVCCDFHFKKFCCSSGEMASELQLQYATVPVPQGI